MFVVARAIIYASIFIGLFLVFVPARFLAWSGIVSPESLGVSQVIGMVVGGAGAVLAIWCVFLFAFIGRGTPAPFDPPRRLVVRGPYRFVRNPMGTGAGLVLAGATLFYQSFPLLCYTGLFALLLHCFVVWYEEPTLSRQFGPEYEAYRRQAGRWWPRRPTRGRSA